MALRYARTAGAWNSTARWSTTSTGATGASIPTAADDVIFTNTNNILLYWPTGYTAVCKSLSINDGCTGGIWAGGSGSINISGSLYIASTARFDPSSANIGFLASGTITTNGKTDIYCNSVNVNSATATLTVVGSLTINGSSIAISAGILDIGSYTITAERFAIGTGTGTKRLNRTTGSIYLTQTAGTTMSVSATGTRIWPTNLPFYLTGTGGATPRHCDLSGAGNTSSTAFNITILGSGPVTFDTSTSTATACYVGDLIFDSSFTGTFLPFRQSPWTQVFGSLQLSSGMTISTTRELWLVGTGTLNSNGKTLDCPLTISAPGGTYTLTGNDFAVGSTRTTTLTQGTLATGSYVFDTGIFSSNNSNTRGITFGGYLSNIRLTSTTAGATVLDMANLTGFSYSTSGGVISRDMDATATITVGTSGATTSNAPPMTFYNGPSALTITSGSTLGTVDFSPCSSPVSGSLNVAGSLTLHTSASYSSLTLTFIGTGTFTPSGNTTIGATTINSTSGTITLGGAFTIASSLTLTAGTFSTAGYSVSTYTFSTSNTNTRTLNLSSSTWVMTGTGTVWDASTSTGLTVNAGTSTLSATSSSTKTFSGGGKTYYNINQANAAALTIAGSNTFNNITNTVQPTTVTFTSGTTQTFISDFGLQGTAGNLVTINSSTPGVQHNLTKSTGTITKLYCSLQDSNATGGTATWYALLTQNNVNAGNNTGWIFTLGGGAMLMMFQ